MAQTQNKIPQICYEQFNQVRNFVNDIIAKYKSLSNWGKPVFTSEMQIACMIWVNERLGIGLQVIANMLGLDKTTLYKLYKKIEETSKFNIYDINTKTIVTIQKSKLDLLQLVEETLQPKAKVVISDLMESAIIREFIAKPIKKRKKVAGHPDTLSDREKAKAMTVVRKLFQYFVEKSMATNPDVWTEDDVEKALFEIYRNDFAKVRRSMKYLRMIPAWSKWFEGKIGAEDKFANPIPRHITYEHYLEIKDLWKRGVLTDEEFLTIWLHLTTGAREGWNTLTQTESTNLEDAISSLVGIKWEKLHYVGGTWILEVYESKTAKSWSVDLSWLDSEPIEILIKKYRKERGSIIESITGLKKIGEFKDFYVKTLEKISELLNLGFKLVPHDIRRSHLAILAEFGVPLEVACGGLMDLGVGWEDLKTAFKFYLRYSRYAKQKVYETITTRKKEIEAIVSQQ